MAEQTQVRSVALFFYFSLLDEPTAQVATLKAIHKLKGQFRSKWTEVSPQVLTQVLNESYKNTNWKKGFKKTRSTLKSGWLLSEGVDIAPWKQFKKEAILDEFLAVVFSKVLGFSDKEVSEGLKISEGTLRHRLNRGLILLSHMLKGEG